MKRSPPPPGAGLTATPVGLPSSQPMPGTSTQVHPPGVPGSGAASPPPSPSGLPLPAALWSPHPAPETTQIATAATAAYIDGSRIAPLYASRDARIDRDAWAPATVCPRPAERREAQIRGGGAS